MKRAQSAVASLFSTQRFLLRIFVADPQKQRGPRQSKLEEHTTKIRILFLE